MVMVAISRPALSSRQAVCVSVCVSTPITASTDSASMTIADVAPPEGRHLTLVPARVETPDGTSVMSHAYAGKLLIRPIGEPGRCRRPETTSQPKGTPKRPDALRVSLISRQRSWQRSTQDHQPRASQTPYRLDG